MSTDYYTKDLRSVPSHRAERPLKKPWLKEHLAAAKAYYQDDYENMRIPGKREKHLSTLRYFDYLELFYEGATLKVLTEIVGRSEGSVRELLRRTESRVERYLSLKDQGLL